MARSLALSTGADDCRCLPRWRQLRDFVGAACQILQHADRSDAGQFRAAYDGAAGLTGPVAMRGSGAGRIGAHWRRKENPLRSQVWE